MPFLLVLIVNINGVPIYPKPLLYREFTRLSSCAQVHSNEAISGRANPPGSTRDRFHRMSFLSKKGLGSEWLILLLAGILGVLGWLQYRSTEQVSEATARDMEESLQSALFNFRHALEGELSSLCLALQ